MRRRALSLLGAIAASSAIALAACATPSLSHAPPPELPGATTAARPSLAHSPPPATAARGGTMVVRFLDVGQGDSTVVTTDDRHAMLVDAGPPEASERVMQALHEVGDASLDVMILTHPHADHMGHLYDVLAGGHFATWLEPGIRPEHPATYDRALSAAEGTHVIRKVVRRGEKLSLGDFVDVTVLAPREPLFSHTRSDLNANSVVVRVDHHAKAKDVRVLFEADAEEPTEKRLLEHPDELRADVLKVAHHGSQYASSEALLEAVSPRLAVISCGRGNDYGHPHARTLKRLEKSGAQVARTDVQGDVTVTSDDRGLAWTTDKTATAVELKSPGRGLMNEAAP